jgi:mycoredoxin
MERNLTEAEKAMANLGSEIIFYGTTWCFDCRRARTVLDQNKIAYTFIDIDKDAEGRKYVEQVNSGFRSVPTIVFPDGSILVEPSNNELKAKLGLS